MLIVTIHGKVDDQKFVVHQSNDGGTTLVDVTDQYEVHALTCQDVAGQIVGWHVGKREPKPPCAHISTTMFVDGRAQCFNCGVEVTEQRLPMELLYTDSQLLPAFATKNYRVCPWDNTNTNLPLGSRVRVRAHVRRYGIASTHVRIYDLNEPLPSPFSPGQPMRNLDRNLPDNILLVDCEPVDLQQGAVVWQELGGVAEHQSPTFSISQDVNNKRVLVVSVENVEQVPVQFSLELYVEVV